MAPLNQVKILTTLREKHIKFINESNFRTLFDVDNKNTLHKIMQRLVKRGILTRIIRGKYVVANSDYKNFELANFIIKPSYISFETALNFYGILSQYPYTTTSATTNRSRSILVSSKEYEYVHLGLKYFWGYEKMDGFLIARPEKALIDTLYICSKGLRKLDLDELDFTSLNKNILKEYLKNFGKPSVTKLLKESEVYD